MEQKSLLQTLSSIIQELKENGQWGTAHVYQSAYNSFALFSCCRDIPFKKFTPALLKDFEIYLRKRKCSWNTVSTYMKVLRATYLKPFRDDRIDEANREVISYVKKQARKNSGR